MPQEKSRCCWVRSELRGLCTWHWQCFHSVLWCCWLGNRKGIRPVKSWVLVCWWWRFDWSFARLISAVVTTISVILRSNKII